MIKYISLTISVALLSGCLSAQEIAEREKIIETEKRQKCANLGAPLGSQQYYHCRQSLELASEREVQRSQEAASSARQYWGNMGKSLTPAPNFSFERQNRVRMQCRTHSIGNQTYTDCN